MDPLPGFVSVPRLAGLSRPAGAFFFARVEGAVGPGQWRATMEGRTLVVTSALDLVPGQTLRLKLMSQNQGHWLFQTVEFPATTVGRRETDPGALALAFLSQGLPAATDRLGLWSRWLTAKPGLPLDKETWAASLESRDAGPHDTLTDAVRPWLEWQAALESGLSSDPPDDNDFWDDWNLHRTPGGQPWLVMPLRWEHRGVTDSGLLQAHWNPQAGAIDRWHLTAAPAQTPFRLEALVRPGRLDLTWCFFRTDDQNRWLSWVQTVGKAPLSTPDLEVTLEVTGIEGVQNPRYRGGIDVEA